MLISCAMIAAISSLKPAVRCLNFPWRIHGESMVYEFGEFALDTKRHELRRRGLAQHVEPQVYAVLCHLLEHRDRLVTSQELIDQVWGRRFVTPGTLNSRIKALRQALGDDGASQRVIQTVRGQGFRFVVDVRTPAAMAATTAAATAAATAATTAAGDIARQQIQFCRAHDGVQIAYAKSGDPSAP